MAAYTNPLNPDAYPGLRKMEAEVVRLATTATTSTAARMTGELFHGGEDMVGTMTSGGTESLILAVLAYRSIPATLTLARGRARLRGVKRPNLVMADTGHVGLDKAVGVSPHLPAPQGHLLGVAVRHVKVDQDTLTPRCSMEATVTTPQWCQHVEKVSGLVNTSEQPNLSEVCFLALFLWL